MRATAPEYGAPWPGNAGPSSGGLRKPATCCSSETFIRLSVPPERTVVVVTHNSGTARQHNSATCTSASVPHPRCHPQQRRCHGSVFGTGSFGVSRAHILCFFFPLFVKCCATNGVASFFPRGAGLPQGAYVCARANAGARRGVGAISKPSKIDNKKRWPSASGVRGRAPARARAGGRAWVRATRAGGSCVSRDGSVS